MPNRSSQDDNQYYSRHQYSSIPPVAPQLMNFSTFPSEGTPGGAHQHYVYQNAGCFTGYGGNISYGDAGSSPPVASAGTHALRYTDPILCPSPSNASTAGQRAHQTPGNAPAPPALSDANDSEADIDSMINFGAESGSETASTRVDQRLGYAAAIPSRGIHPAQHSRDVRQPRPASRPSPKPNPKRPKPKRLRTSDYLDSQSPFIDPFFTQDPSSPLAFTRLEDTSTGPTVSPSAYGPDPTASSLGYYQIVAEPPGEDDSVFTEERQRTGTADDVRESTDPDTAYRGEKQTSGQRTTHDEHEHRRERHRTR